MSLKRCHARATPGPLSVGSAVRVHPTSSCLAMATASSPPTPRYLSDPPKGGFLCRCPDELGRWGIERRHCQVQGNKSGVVRVDTLSSIPDALWRIAPNRAGKSVMHRYE